MTRARQIQPGKTLIELPKAPEARQLPTNDPVVQYVRQSTRKQLRENATSRETQDVNMHSRLGAYGWKDQLILKIDIDTGKSGRKRKDQRTGLAQLYELIDTGGAKAVAAHNVSRIYRTLSKAEMGAFCDLVLERGVPVITTHRIYWPTQADNDALLKDFQKAAEWIQEHIHETMIYNKNYHIQEHISYAGHSIPLGFVVDDLGKLAQRKFYRIYEPHAAKIRWLFKRFRELSGNLPLLRRELVEIDFRFPAFEDGIRPHVSLRADENGTYPLRSRDAIMGILTNRAYIGWQVYSGVIVSKEAHDPIVSMDDFLFAWHCFNDCEPDGTDCKQEKIVRERRYGGKNALLDGILQAGKLPVYVIRNHYTSWEDNDGFGKQDMAVPVKTIDAAFAPAMVATLAKLEHAHRRGLQEELYQRVEALKKEEEKKAADYAGTLARVEKEIKNQEMAQRVSREEGDEQGYRDATRQLVILRRDKAAIEAKLKQASTEASELAECRNLIECAVRDWSKMSMPKRKRLVKLVVESASMVEISPHFIRLDVRFNDIVCQTLSVYIFRPRGSRIIWTPEEVETLARLYPTASKQDIMEALPSHGWDALKKKAGEIGIQRPHQKGDASGGKLLALSQLDLHVMQKYGVQPDKPMWIAQNSDDTMSQLFSTDPG